SGFEGELENLTGLRFSDKTLTTNVVVGDQEVVVIGGLTQNSFVNTVQGVPILSAIPILGNLFKQDVTENNKSELVIVVTAEIIEKPRTHPMVRAAHSGGSLFSHRLLA